MTLTDSTETQLAAHLSQFVCSLEFSDLCIRSVNGTELPAHRCIVAVRCSELFDTMSDGVIDTDIETDLLRHVLCYLYTDDAPTMTAEEAPLLANVATDLMLARLERLTARAVRQPMVIQEGLLAADIASLHEEHADVTITLADGTSRKGHAIMLARIRAFRQLFSEERDVAVEDITAKQLDSLWHYAYHGNVVGASLRVLMQLIPWSRATRDTALMNACVRELIRVHINVKTVCDILMSSMAFSLPTVVTHCKQFIKAHEEVRALPSFQQLPEELQQELTPPTVPIKPPTPRDMRERRLKVNLRLLAPAVRAKKDTLRTGGRTQ